MEETQQKLGKYTLVRHLATGGMAEIWLAEQEGPGGFNKQLVIKRVLSHLASDSQFTQMFLDEARLVAQLTHPNIGQINELGELDGSYFIAMEYIDGLDLSVILENLDATDQKLPIELAVYVVSQVLLALEYAHNFVDREGNFVGLVHRDVTPHNVLVSNDGVIKLVDFGVAKAAANQAKTQAGAVKGKFAYMAPEQINNQPLDRRVDIFAAGVVLYELITGGKPFGDDLFAVNSIISKPTPDPREVRPDIPQSLVNIINVALSKDREQRYQNAQAMMEDLEDFLRASHQYVGQRDLAAYVRNLQGIEMTGSFTLPNTRGSGPRARITEKESAIAEAERLSASSSVQNQPPITGEQAPVTSGNSPITGPQTPPTTTAPNTGEQAPITGGQPPITGGQAPVTGSTEAVGQGGPGKGLIAVFAIVVIAILGAGGAVLMIAVSGDSKKKSDPKVKVVKDTKDPVKKPAKTTPTTPKEKPDPSKLLHKDGLLVFLDAPKKAKIYYEGTYVGDTRMQTTLRPGEYSLVFESGGKKIARTVEVEEGKPLQTITVKF